MYRQRDGLEDALLAKVADAGATFAPRRSFGRLFTDWQFVKRAFRYVFNLPMRMETEDRRVLEQVIFPHFKNDPAIKSVLFVGVDWYTKHYDREFFPGVNYWTIDPVPAQAKFGSRNHVIAPMEDIDQHFPEAKFDLIICNGVYGYGLNTPEQCEHAFQACYSRLKEGGRLVIGWDDLPARRPVPFDSIGSLLQFERCAISPFLSWRKLTDTPYRHTYDFYRKGVRVLQGASVAAALAMVRFGQSFQWLAEAA